VHQGGFIYKNNESHLAAFRLSAAWIRGKLYHCF